MIPTEKHSFGKWILSFGFIFISSLYTVWQNTSLQQAGSSPAQEFRDANDAFLKALIQNRNTTTTPFRSQLTAQGTYTDGSYTGSAEDAYYGTVQVNAIVTNGKIDDVQFLQYPNTRNTSRTINNKAMPILTQEAIQAQSAEVDGVSGATFTSQAFIQSLASALAQAKR